MTSHKTRLTVTILLFFTLAAGASALTQGVRPTQPQGFLELLWKELTSWIVRPAAAQASPDEKEPRQKEGPQMDPNGGNG